MVRVRPSCFRPSDEIMMVKFRYGKTILRKAPIQYNIPFTYFTVY